MSPLLALLPLALLLTVYAVLIKAAARLYRKSQLPWKHAFAFCGLAVLVGVAGAMLNLVTGSALGPGAGVLLGFATQLGLGGWYLGPRSSTAAGEPIGFKGGVVVAAIGYGLIVLLGIVAAIVLPLLGRGGPA